MAQACDCPAARRDQCPRKPPVPWGRAVAPASPASANANQNNLGVRIIGLLRVKPTNANAEIDRLSSFSTPMIGYRSERGGEPSQRCLERKLFELAAAVAQLLRRHA